MAESSAATTAVEEFSAYDLRLRSIDREPGEPINLCSGCGEVAYWSVWLHTPEWGSGNAGLTVVRCTPCAITALVREAVNA